MIVKKYKIKFIGNIEGGGLGVSNIFKDVDVIPLEGGIVDHREDLKKFIPWFDYISPKVHRAKVDGKVLIYSYTSGIYGHNYPAVTVAYSKSARPLTDIENWAWITVFGISIYKILGQLIPYINITMLTIDIKKGYYYYIARRFENDYVSYNTYAGFKCVFLPDGYRFPQIGTEYLKYKFNNEQVRGWADKIADDRLDFTLQNTNYSNKYLNSREIKGCKTFYNPKDNDGWAYDNKGELGSINHIRYKTSAEFNSSVMNCMNTEILKVIDKK